jgi:hypothetical protein
MSRGDIHYLIDQPLSCFDVLKCLPDCVDPTLKDIFQDVIKYEIDNKSTLVYDQIFYECRFS